MCAGLLRPSASCGAFASREPARRRLICGSPRRAGGRGRGQLSAVVSAVHHAAVTPDRSQASTIPWRMRGQVEIRRVWPPGTAALLALAEVVSRDDARAERLRRAQLERRALFELREE